MAKPSHEIVPHHVQGHIVGQRRDDGYINVTELCKRAGKHWSNYWQNKASKRVAKEIAAVHGIPWTKLIDSKWGGDPRSQGTWAHPELAVHVAYWAGGPKWKVRIGRIVIDWMQGLPRQKFYDGYLLHSPAEKARQFVDEFYHHIERMWGVQRRNGNYPQWVGALTKDLIYDRMQRPGLAEELDNRNPVLPSGHRRDKQYQFLDDAIALPELQKHLYAVIVVMRAAHDKDDFMSRMDSSLARTVRRKPRKRPKPPYGTQGEPDL